MVYSKKMFLKLISRLNLWKGFAFWAFFIGGAFVSPVYAQYSGGNEVNQPAGATIGSDIYNGGAQNNLS